MKQLVAGVVMLTATVAAAWTPDAEMLQKRREFAEQRFGIFIHWGLYSTYAQGEWYLQNAKGEIKESDYAQAMHGFYPARFDARAWAKTFRKAGADDCPDMVKRRRHSLGDMGRVDGPRWGLV